MHGPGVHMSVILTTRHATHAQKGSKGISAAHKGGCTHGMHRDGQEKWTERRTLHMVARGGREKLRGWSYHDTRVRSPPSCSMLGAVTFYHVDLARPQEVVCRGRECWGTVQMERSGSRSGGASRRKRWMRK